MTVHDGGDRDYENEVVLIPCKQCGTLKRHDSWCRATPECRDRTWTAIADERDYRKAAMNPNSSQSQPAVSDGGDWNSDPGLVDVETIIRETVRWDYARFREGLGNAFGTWPDREPSQRVLRSRTNQQRDLIEHVIEQTCAAIGAMPTVPAQPPTPPTGQQCGGESDSEALRAIVEILNRKDHGPAWPADEQEAYENAGRWPEGMAAVIELRARKILAAARSGDTRWAPPTPPTRTDTPAEVDEDGLTALEQEVARMIYNGVLGQFSYESEAELALLSLEPQTLAKEITAHIKAAGSAGGSGV
jgi:hypothetical protein